MESFSMPIYEYQCTSCNHHFDLMQKISDEPVRQCPVCYKNSVVKLVSAAGFQLKGSGWYATDFKNKPKEAAKNDETVSKDKTKETPSSQSNKDGDTK